MKQADGVIYLHGAPGGPLELQLFGDPAGDGGARFHAPDRSTFAPDLAFGAYIDRLAEDIAARFDGSLRLVGFSMGTFIALNLAQRLGDRISRIDLVSSAAPLSTGDYLPAMAGAAVFRMARTQQKLFSAVSRAQFLAARHAPGLLHHALFSTARGEDAALVRDPRFKAMLRRMLLGALAGGAVNFRREITAYVADWSSLLATIRQPVTLWHGQDDNWSPPAMADYLSHTLPNVAAFERLEGLSHYSTLRHVLTRLV